MRLWFKGITFSAGAISEGVPVAQRWRSLPASVGQEVGGAELLRVRRGRAHLFIPVQGPHGSAVEFVSREETPLLEFHRNGGNPQTRKDMISEPCYWMYRRPFGNAGLVGTRARR